ncbi:MAG TPA: glycoside hydrolase family 16 protein [Allosphingosinicella sp.]|nr:glycoside hydrolase family 16 protein [Allosphingosinicella sp.]
MKPSALIVGLGLALAACNPNLTTLDPAFHPTQRGWMLVWSDDFNVPAAAPDPTKWVVAKYCGGFNNEKQCHTAGNVEVMPAGGGSTSGYLRIRAKHEPGKCDGTDAGTAAGNNEQGTTHCPPTGSGPQYDYSSARVQTRLQHVGSSPNRWQYGRIEIRARLPQGTGTWPAFWMLPNPSIYGWPASGEIDILEAVNLHSPALSSDYLQSAVHACSTNPSVADSNPSSQAVANCNQYATARGGGAYAKASVVKPLFLTPFAGSTPDVVNAFHTYSLEWSDWDMRFYLDDRLIHQFYYSSLDLQPFRAPFYLILNLAVGGDMTQKTPPFHGDWIDGGLGPHADLLVDWVRIYACGPDTTAENCIYKGQGLGKQ